MDLGSETGTNIIDVIRGTEILAHNVYIADIDSTLVEIGKENFGFTPVHISESEKLPFNDMYFDIVYCSSVIEHVTIPKEKVWSVLSGKKFKNFAIKRQKEFADEIKRLGRQYFIQTPYKHFPVESHTWLPFLSWMPRRILIRC